MKTPYSKPHVRLPSRQIALLHAFLQPFNSVANRRRGMAAVCDWRVDQLEHGANALAVPPSTATLAAVAQG